MLLKKNLAVHLVQVALKAAENWATISNEASRVVPREHFLSHIPQLLSLDASITRG